MYSYPKESNLNYEQRHSFKKKKASLTFAAYSQILMNTLSKNLLTLLIAYVLSPKTTPKS